MRLLVTGGAGFIGSNFVRHWLAANPQGQLLNLDNLTYAGNLENLAGVAEQPNYQFYRADISQPVEVAAAFAAGEQAFGGPFDAIMHFAAESHVDRSIDDPAPFLQTNIVGTQVLLEIARRKSVPRFVQVSTDEVYGSLGESGAFAEENPLVPNSPYAASKAGADLMARAYWQTYDLPVIITRCTNNYGPFQFPEKLIPLMIANALEDRPLPVYGDGLNVRDWIYVEDHCRALALVLQSGVPGQIYNIGGRAEKTNLAVVRTILQLLGKPESLITFVPDRPGHDRRYAMNIAKIERELGWQPQWDFARGMEATINWYLANQDWVSHVRSGAYREYYHRMYEARTEWLAEVGGAAARANEQA